MAVDESARVVCVLALVLRSTVFLMQTVILDTLVLVIKCFLIRLDADPYFKMVRNVMKMRIAL